MKGLFYRELFLGRKSIISGAATFLIIAVLCALVRLSLMVGNLSKLQGDGLAAVDTLTYYIALYLPGITALVSISPSGSIALSDLNGKWGSFAKTFPAGTGKQAAVKLAVIVLSTAAAYVLGSINALAMWSAEGKAPSADFFKNTLIAAAAVILFEALSVPLIFWFKTKFAKDILLLTPMFALIAFAGTSISEMVKRIFDIIVESSIDGVLDFISAELTGLRDTALAASFPVIILSLAAGFLGTRAALKRRV